ncbi:structural maintenance of chromosomes protein 2 [Tribolium madens]|uniref:structural maintenance of chromosomes protein 2 n=1 Tax=Tribolium madens TaxID=41895 RepID=UPI001CF72A0F|nr:structural maintenance of chromosomes protein 2 [Tribolium madens]
MYIKSVVLDGFKSYGHRTEISGFDKAFNAITGLNGSGKSNILDSICFVLGITNLSHVRVGNLQDLIYKSGQCGIDKATVSITFDNSNPDQCPPGFEDVSEITISRQIVMGGKSKYMINGMSVQNKKVHDLFCSIQLNVNNPHFLIMQGKITKVLNMKPFEILGMIEEGAGTKMYTSKRDDTLKTIQKKDAKLTELQSIMNEVVTPRLEKLRAERTKYVEFKNIERELDHMLRLYKAWEFVASKRRYLEVKNTLENEENDLKNIEEEKTAHKSRIKELDGIIKELTKKAEADGNQNLEKLEQEIRTAEKSQAKVNANIKSINDEIENETKRKTQLEKNLADDEKTLKVKESNLAKVESTFLKLKAADEKDKEAFVISQKRVVALSAGMELNDQGEAESLLAQLMNMRQKASEEINKKNCTLVKLKYYEDRLKEKQVKGVNSNEIIKDQQMQKNMSQEIDQLKAAMKKMHFKEDRMNDLKNRRTQLSEEMKVLRRQVDNFEMRNSFTQFRYRDPEPNFNKKSVMGVVCRLFKVKDETACYAVEMAAGGRLYNVVIDSDITGKKLLKHGDLQQRRTFIPLNKIQVNKMSNSVVKRAEDLVGKENIKLALDYLSYDKKMQSVMEHIFGNVFICKDMSVARRVAFDNRIRRKCVTLDGDIVDPAGTLTGGSREQTESVLKQLDSIQQIEQQLSAKEHEFEKIESEIREIGLKEEQFMTYRRELELKEHELNLITERLQQSTYYQHKEEIANLEKEIKNLKETIASCEENEKKLNEKVKSLEEKVAGSKGGIEQKLKEAQAEMARLKAKADKSKKQWEEKELDYATFKGEIEELKQSLLDTKQQIEAAEANIMQLKQKLEEIGTQSTDMNANIAELQAELKKGKAEIVEKNKDVQKKVNEKEELQSKITQCEIRIKESSHKLKKLQDECKNLKGRQADCQQRVKGDEVKTAEQMSEEEGQELEKKIRKFQEMKKSLGRTVNSQAQVHFEQQEKEYNEVKKKLRIVEQDKRTLLDAIKELDLRREEIVCKAHEQISRDFGSIFSTLLPGATAKLLPPTGQTILQGVEIKVSLGGIWKDSLTELSGGQRSLAALSLILAMLLFKPAPLYILDEIDAALDLSHTQNIGRMLKTHFKKSQFIVVSLKDGMFSNANVLFKTQFVDGVSTVTRTAN